MWPTWNYARNKLVSTNKCYVHEPEFIQKTETYNILSDFEIQNEIQKTRPLKKNYLTSRGFCVQQSIDKRKRRYIPGSYKGTKNNVVNENDGDTNRSWCVLVPKAWKETKKIRNLDKESWQFRPEQ